MVRTLAPIIWLFSIFALSFNAAAQPCEFRMELQAQESDMASADMPCHGHEAVEKSTKSDKSLPRHPANDSCCCAVLINTALCLSTITIEEPIAQTVQWTHPLPESASSIDLEYEPPPPRA